MQKTHILAYASLRMDQQKQFWPVNTSSTDKSKEGISTTPFFPSIMSPLNWKMEYNNKIIRHSVQIPIVWLYSYQWGLKTQLVPCLISLMAHSFTAPSHEPTKNHETIHYAVNLYLIFCLILNFNVKEIKIRCVLNIILQKKRML